jgi:hypothetical protein
VAVLLRVGLGLRRVPGGAPDGALGRRRLASDDTAVAHLGFCPMPRQSLQNYSAPGSPMLTKPQIFAVQWLCLLLLPTGAVKAQMLQHSDEDSASGDDLLQRLSRISLRTEVASEHGEKTRTITLRIDRPILINDRWRLKLRADLPFRSVEKDHRDWSGLTFGDALLSAVFVRRLDDGQAFGIGSQLIIPTAKKEVQGRQQWRLRPTASYRWPVHAISEGTYFKLEARFDMSITGGSSEEKTRELQLAPNLEIDLPGRSYLSIFPNPDIQYDFVRNELFVPIDVEIGKQFGHVLISIEVAKALVKGNNAPYDWRVEPHVGLKF